jgi:hypothetical protein
MLAFLSGLAFASVTVPFVNHDSMHLYPMGIPELESTLDEIPRICTFVHDPKSAASTTARSILYRVIPLFSDDLLFVELDSHAGKNLTDALNITAPHLVFYINGSFWAHYNFPSSETFLLHLLDFQGTFFSHHPAISRATLARNLGASYLSLVYPSNEDSMAVWIHRQAAGIFGSLDLVPFENSEAEKFGLKPGQFYLFRMEDTALLPVEPNLDDVVRHTRPAFRRFTLGELGQGFVFAIVAQRYTQEIVGILEAAASKFQGYAVGLISPPLYDIANMSVGGTIREIPAIVIFNAAMRVYLPIAPETAAVQGRSPAEVIGGVEALLGDTSAFVSVSERIPADQNRPYVKLVGETYAKFVEDKDVVAVVLYVAQGGKKVRQYIEAFAIAASRVNSAKVRFGAINVTANFAAFPPMSRLPRIQIFPIGDKARPRPFFGRVDPDAILRYVGKITGETVAEKVAKETNRDRAVEILNIWKQNRTLRSLELSVAQERLEELQSFMHMKAL